MNKYKVIITLKDKTEQVVYLGDIGKYKLSIPGAIKIFKKQYNADSIVIGKETEINGETIYYPVAGKHGNRKIVYNN